MVTSGSARQSSRPPSRAGLAVSASAVAAAGNTCGIEWAWMAMRLTARSVASEPSLSPTPPPGTPNPGPARRHRDRHQVAIARVCAGARWDRKLVAELFLVDRREPPAAARRRAVNAEHALAGAVDELDDAPGVADRIVLFAALL